MEFEPAIPEASGRRPTLLTAHPLGSASLIALPWVYLASLYTIFNSGHIIYNFKRYISKLHFSIILQTTVAQLVEALQYKPEGPRFCYF
jgi:hypothetical protein